MKKVDEAITSGETTSLSIDFKSGDTLDDDIARLPDLETLALRNCPPTLALPNALRSLTKLREMTLTGAGDKLTIPKAVADLPLAHVGVWHLANLDDLALLTRVPSLFIVVDDPKPDVVAIARVLPHLTRLEIWGSHLKSGELPSDISKFTNLEVLHLVSCGVSDLPKEILELKKLRELRMRALPMKTIPDVVGDLPALETLEFGIAIAALPPSLTKPHTLVRLDLAGALNGGTMLSSFDEEQFVRMKPIPKTLTEMTWLKELRLGRCGVVDTSPLRALVNLEKLSLDWSAMPTLDDIGALTSLQELTLDNCSRAHDFAPLANLKNLRVLDMKNTEPSSLEFLKSLPSLTNLDIDRVECDDMRPLYDLEIANLEASDDVMKKWNDRAAVRKLPSIDDVKKDLESSNLATIERAILALAQQVRAASSEDQNALASIFDSEIESETKVLEIPALDGALKTNAEKLSNDALAAIFGATLLQIGNNFNAALIAANEIVRRKDEDLQLHLVNAFFEACESYDAGHRYDEDTVHDRLIDKIFPKLEAKPLAALLEWCRNDYLNRDGGDRMDALFACAFAGVKDDETWEKLTTKLRSYTNDQIGYGKQFVVDQLLAEAKVEVNEGFTAKFAAFQDAMLVEQAAARSLARIETDARSSDTARIVAAIAESSALDDKTWKNLSSALGTGAERDGVPWESRRIVFDRALALGDDSCVSDVLTRLVTEDAARARREIEATALPKEKLAKLLRGLLLRIARKRKKARGSFPHDAVRAWASELDGISADASHAKELTETVRGAAQSYDEEAIGDAVDELAAFSGSIDMTEKDASYGGMIGDRLADAVGQLVTYAEDAMFALALQLHKIKLADKTRERILAQLFGLAAANDRDDIIAAITPLLPQSIENPILAYNLACHAAKSKNKTALLTYTARALQLGKSPTQFRDDSDFTPFLDDGEFKTLLDRAL